MYESHPWNHLKFGGHEKDDVVRLVYDIDSWLLVDGYLPATTVVGSLASEIDLHISDDFMVVTEWRDLVVWPFRSTGDREQFEKELNEAIYSLMTNEFASSNWLSQKLSQKLFRHEKRVDIKVSRYASFEHTIRPPFDRYEGKWRWAEIPSFYNYPIDLDGDMLQLNITVIKKNFANVKEIDPVESPNTRVWELSVVGGQYVRAMGRLALMRKVVKLGKLLHNFPIRVRGG
jgi:hypothetical protein